MAGSQSAGNRVFNTTELLEAILLNFDIKHVWKCTLLNRQWRHVIENSGPLQRSLFLQPLSATSTNGQRCLSSKPIINPLLTEICASEDNQDGLQHLDFYVGPYSMHWFEKKGRDMFFTQPHRSAARLHCMACRRDDDGGWYGIQHDKGIRVGMVQNEIVKHVETFHPDQDLERISTFNPLNVTLRFSGNFLLPPVECVARDVLDMTLKLESPGDPTGWKGTTDFARCF